MNQMNQYPQQPTQPQQAGELDAIRDMVGGDPSAYLSQNLSHNPALQQFMQTNGGMTIGQMLRVAPDSPVKALVQTMLQRNSGFVDFMQAHGNETLGQYMGERFGMPSPGGPL